MPCRSQSKIALPLGSPGQAPAAVTLPQTDCEAHLIVPHQSLRDEFASNPFIKLSA